MPTRRPFITPGLRTIVVALSVAALVGCSPTTAPSAATGGLASTPQTPTTAASPTVAGPSPTVAGLDAPPEAVLAAEGGDPIEGQLGTYVWLETGSDAPWLPGAPIAVGAGEPLTVALVGGGGIDTWSARYVPADATGPAGAVSLGEGPGDPAFTAPGSGAWTLEVLVEFAAGAGNASYFWRLEVE